MSWIFLLFMATTPFIHDNNAYYSRQRRLLFMTTMLFIHDNNAFYSWQRRLLFMTTMLFIHDNNAFYSWQQRLLSMTTTPFIHDNNAFYSWQQSLFFMRTTPFIHDNNAFYPFIRDVDCYKVEKHSIPFSIVYFSSYRLPWIVVKNLLRMTYCGSNVTDYYGLFKGIIICRAQRRIQNPVKHLRWSILRK